MSSFFMNRESSNNRLATAIGMRYNKYIFFYYSMRSFRRFRMKGLLFAAAALVMLVPATAFSEDAGDRGACASALSTAMSRC